MFDGIKLLDLSVSADALLQSGRLLFPLPVDEQTGAVLDQPRRSVDRGLTFSLIPRQSGGGYRVELVGSIHRYHRGGLHNADDFTAADLLAALNELVTTYGIDPFCSRLNNVEFGVNVILPFPVARVLDNLIGYKNRPFYKEPGDGFTYYQCHTQRYIVKLYDKGAQYGLPANVLRVEVKVLKMEYLTRRGINIDRLADLLTVSHYSPLGTLLVDTFTEVLFDEPTINPALLTRKERDVYQNGRNPKSWFIPDGLPPSERPRLWKQLQRADRTFRALLDKHRQGADWQHQTAALIGLTWNRLTVITPDLLTAINDRLSVWSETQKCPLLTGSIRQREEEKCPELTGVPDLGAGRGTVEKCPLLTGFGDELLKGELSTINPLSIVLIVDNPPVNNGAATEGRGTPAEGGVLDQSGVEFSDSIKKGQLPVEGEIKQPGQPAYYCLITGLDITHQTGRRRFVSTSTLRRLYELDRQTFDVLAERYLPTKQRGAALDQQCESIAHSIRNTATNPRNNPLRRIKQYGSASSGQTLPLFTATETVIPTERIKTALEHRRGTRWEIQL